MAEWNLRVTRREPGNRACIIFVHGFQGDPKRTWGEFPKYILENPAANGWDILSFGYESDLAPDLIGVWEGDPSIQMIANSLRVFANTQLAYDGILFIAHSMGGLVVQRALLDDENLTKKVDKVILFGTPSFGLKKAWIFQLPILRLLNRQVSDMGRTSDFIKSLRSDWKERFSPAPPFGFLAVAGSEDEFVPSSASIDEFPESQCAVVPGNHLEIVDAKSSRDASVGVVLDFMRGKDLSQWRLGTAALALERRQFQTIVDDWWKNRDRLDSRALVKLALALDGLGRRADAMAILADAKRHGTDAMGVLAGRHKRNWIKERVVEEAQSAIALYEEAFEIAKNKPDFSQAYYHGINLTFFELCYTNDPNKAREIANTVLDYCAKAKSNENAGDKLWRLATEGEANLILGNIDVALKRYDEAFDGPPKPRPWQFTSTAQQALLIADALGDEQIAERLLNLFGGRRL